MAPKLKGPKIVIAPGSAPAVGGVMPSLASGDTLGGSIPEGEIKFKDKDLEFLGELGAGNGGSVSKVLHIPSGIIMARKNVSVSVDDEQDRKKAEKQLKSELKILHICRSEFIVSSFGAFSHDGCVSICMEYMDLGSLEHIYKTCGPIPEVVGIRVAVHVLKGLLYLAEKNIIHRDIKPSNILVNTQGQIKIADFGVSKEIVNTQARTFTGTQAYLAPERVECGNDYNVVSDVWSLGLALIEISTGKFPYQMEVAMSIFDLITYISENPAPGLPAGAGFSSGFEEVVNL
ncbi:Dual specificity mitogen-activated protein kinase kinase 1, partial [Blyttiomyces sp. JEL0837]